MRFRANLASMIGAATIVLGACGSATPAPPECRIATSPAASNAAASEQAAASTDPWTSDLAKLDESVRRVHPAPFTIHPEAEWTAKLAQLRASLPTAAPDEQLVQLASLVGLLDTHSYLDWRPGAKFYEVLVYQFSDGIYAIRATDPRWSGRGWTRSTAYPSARSRHASPRSCPTTTRVVSSIRSRACIPRSNTSTAPESSRTRPSLGTRSSGRRETMVVVDPGAVELSGWEQELGIVGDLMGDKPEAVARRTEPAGGAPRRRAGCSSLPTTTTSIRRAALAAMKAALDAKKADRVVLDLRYLRGGNGSIAFPLVEGLAAERRSTSPAG